MNQPFIAGIQWRIDFRVIRTRFQNGKTLFQRLKGTALCIDVRNRIIQHINTVFLQQSVILCCFKTLLQSELCRALVFLIPISPCHGMICFYGCGINIQCLLVMCNRTIIIRSFHKTVCLVKLTV